MCITTTQLFNRNSLSVCNERRRPVDISRSLSAPCEKGENLTVSTIRPIGVLLQEDVKTQTTVLDLRNWKSWTNCTIADLLPCFKTFIKILFAPRKSYRPGGSPCLLMLKDFYYATAINELLITSALQSDGKTFTTLTLLFPAWKVLRGCCHIA